MTAPRRISRQRVTPTMQIADEIASHTIPQATPEEQAAARLTIADRAETADDARLLMAMLGLIP